MKKSIFGIGVLILAILAGSVYAVSVEQSLSGGLVRLHVMANSNAKYDQQIKLLVRDTVLSQVQEGISKNISRDELLQKADALQQIAQNKLEELGVCYSARVCVGNDYFPRKSYAKITLPAGRYDSIRIILGEGAGENWWCVAYPPLCFVEGAVGEFSPEGEALLKRQLSPQSYELIQNTNDVEIRYRLKMVELFNEIREMMRKGKDA